MKLNIVEKTKEKYFLYEKRHQEIIESAIGVFNAKGYKAATTAAIAKSARISEPTMYKHFKNKKDLFLTCFNSIVNTLFDENRKIYEKCKDDEVGYFRGVTKAYFDFVQKNPDKSMFLVHMLSYRDDPDVRKAYQAVIGIQKKHILAVLKSAEQKGIVRNDIDLRFLSAFFAAQYYSVVAVKEIVDPKLFVFENFSRLAEALFKL